jgi:queuine tRNA-ribosyltransferase
VPDYPGFSFQITARDSGGSRARTGRYETPHGAFDTPAFIFCGTKAAVKTVTPAQVKEAGTSIILSNTYHLMLQPGADLVARFGGLHKFMGWDGPMLTDSGGFQVFSLGHGSVAEEIKGSRNNARPPTLIKVSEEGAEFRSYIDGSRHTLTPESSIEIQQKLGADLIVVFDECTAFHDSRDYTAKSMDLTHRWAKRCLTAFERGQESSALDRRQALYGIVQGGVYPDLREVSAQFVDSQSFFGLAVGGSLGGSKGQMREVVGMTMAHLNGHRPVHLLGIGSFADIIDNVQQGIDTFDCVAPTRMARHGGALLKGAPGERINLRNAQYREDGGPIDPHCVCHACRNFSRGYIHHLLKAGEGLAGQLISIHNIAVMNRLMREVRQAIAGGTLAELRRQWVAD